MTEFDETRILIDGDSNVNILRPKGREIKEEERDTFNIDRANIINFCKINNIDLKKHLKPRGFKEMLKNVGVKAEFGSKFLAKVRSQTGRNNTDKIPFITLSDIESKTLRLFIPIKQVEKRIINISLSHKNKPGALFVITKLLAESKFSIYSSLVRTFHPKNPKEERNVFEAMIEHESKDIEKELLNDNTELWIKKFLKTKSLMDEIKYFDIHLEKPQFPSGLNFKATPLSSIKQNKNYHFEVNKNGEEEKDIKSMKMKFEKNEVTFKGQNWLTNLLFSKEWSDEGLPTVFLSYPKEASEKANYIIEKLNAKFDFVVFQNSNTMKNDPELPTEIAIKKIKSCQYFIGLFHYDESQEGNMSPWLLFEYGVAKSHNKPLMILSPPSLMNTITKIEKRLLIPYETIVGNDTVIDQLIVKTNNWFINQEKLVVEPRK